MNTTISPQVPAEGRTAITVAALLATYLQAVNISLPNAALPHIQGSLSMGNDEVGWVFSAYIVASVVVLPMTNWLAGRYGRKTIFQLALALFAIGMTLNTFATTSIQFVAARILQGAASGPVAPLSIAILLEVVSPARHARTNLGFTLCFLLGISSGPSIGGWLSEYYGWRSISYACLAPVAFIFAVMALFLPEKKAEHNRPFDFFGLLSFSLGMVGLQMFLDRSERLDWFASAEIWAEGVSSILGFYLFIVHVATSKTHFLNSALFRDRNLIVSTVMSFALGFVLLPTLALTSPMLEELLDYPVDTTGYMTLPRGMMLVGTVIVMSMIPSRFDNRPFVILGSALIVYANWQMLGYSPLMDQWAVAKAGLFQGAGLGILIPALAKVAFATLDPQFRPEGGALLNISRLYGSTLGISVVQLFFYNNTQAMHLALAKGLTPHHAAAHIPETLTAPILAGLNGMVTHQAATVAVIDQFKILMFAMAVVSPLALLLRPSSFQK
ncbi:multidrug efflux MFS transporter [Tardiphaga robiniae]|uniref:Multidrug efflux MFS transporter n=2 Tax=Tardiphaga robiniae TaxID=943830 RepID=A0A7G6U8D6_9BRAD|nr:multidrug efflux MFS transporter [Tardiphaga robiniae]